MLMRKLRALCAGLAVLVLSGCVTPPPDANTALPSDQDCYVVLGVTPLNMRVEIVDGSIKNGTFNTAFFRMTTPSYMPDDSGYVVMKVKSNTHYAILSASAMFGRQPVFGQQYLATDGRTLAFDAPAGGVVYITGLTYRHVNTGLEMTQNPDLEGARGYLRQHYPQLAGRLVQGRYGAVRLN